MAPAKQIYQLKIVLEDIEPPMWRTIQISSTCTFWDLHSYIQDAFGWTNSHLHQFTYTDPITGAEKIFGIPSEDDEMYDLKVYAGWSNKVSKYLNQDNPIIQYVYDLGDNWQHIIELEQILPPEHGIKYPRCIAGERNGPPEDCGGAHGYAGLLETLFDPSDPEHEDTVAWVDSMKGCTFCPEEFDPAMVRFMSPKKRFKESLA